MGTENPKYATRVGKSTMRIGENQRSSSFHTTNKRSKKDEKYRQTGRGFNKKEPPIANNPEFESMLELFVVVYEKRNDTTDAMIRNQ